MQDEPTADELLTAIADFLSRDVQPGLEGRTQYHLRVALNLIQVLRHELALEPAAQQREWEGLRGLAGLEGIDRALRDEPLSRGGLLAANDALCAAIRAGTYDSETPEGGLRRAALFAHLRTVLADKLRIANPEFLERVVGEQGP